MMFKFFCFLFCLLISLTACHKQEANQRQNIRLAVAQAPINLDPRYATDAASVRVNRLLYRSLVGFDASSKPVADLATWQMISPTQYRFKLGEAGRKFHDGSQLSTKDVKATYESLLALKDSPLSAEFTNIRRIETLDGARLDIYLKAADSAFPAKLIIGILPASQIVAGRDFSHNPLGSGALAFVSWTNTLQLKRVTDSQIITLLEVKDPTVRILKLMRGEVDILQGDLPPELVRYLKTQPNINVTESNGANFSYLGFNLQDKTLANIKVRRAIAHSIDRSEIIQQVLVGGTREAGAILPPEHWAGNAKLASYEFNPALSKKLLKEAGVILPLHLVYKTSTDAQRVRLATIMQAQMAEAGIALEIKSLDWGTFFEDVKQGHFQLFGLTWVGINTPDIYAKAFGSDNAPPKGFNRGRFSDAQLDALLAKHDWQAATKIIHQQLPYVPLWYEGQFTATRVDISQYAPKPDGNWDDLANVIRTTSPNTH
ncbi:ABC transporter substrate-binding protein [Candidatus Methylopumilus turicensis]|uniref:Extracellular solute-binding protein family 5 n=1 Tax=Candidatus Methylopumilus turicensis TaxID=1581680 RepID=A0A0B7ITT8_9PROT|nr:ABC transporter substrate-binding protein [Candidatus Methylopumilus turicensis]CEN55700.1 Extracellular solute-binding protein family 5 [Candidatus Methylopumilus turicensis]